jgi:hypothetical protein
MSKAARDLQGWYGGPGRAPLATQGGDAIDEITESLASAGLLIAVWTPRAMLVDLKRKGMEEWL